MRRIAIKLLRYTSVVALGAILSPVIFLPTVVVIGGAEETRDILKGAAQLHYRRMVGTRWYRIPLLRLSSREILDLENAALTHARTELPWLSADAASSYLAFSTKVATLDLSTTPVETLNRLVAPREENQHVSVSWWPQSPLALHVQISVTDFASDDATSTRNIDMSCASNLLSWACAINSVKVLR